MTRLRISGFDRKKIDFSAFCPKYIFFVENLNFVIFIDLPHRAKREAKRILINLSPQAKREAKGIYVNLSPRAKREAKGILVKLQPRAKREAQ